MTLGLLGVQRLRNAIREHVDDPRRLVEALDAVMEAELTPSYKKTSGVVPGSPRSTRSAGDARPNRRAVWPGSGKR